MDNKRNVVFIAGKDPSIALSGQVSYVRAHAMAAREAGFVPHIFCPSSRSDSTESDFGVVHRIRTAVVQAATPHFHKSFLPWQAQLMAPVIVRFFESRPGTRLIHAFASLGLRRGARVPQTPPARRQDIVDKRGLYDREA
jgi:hypothetical protein